MGTTPLLDRINARRKVGRIGPVSPVPIAERMSPFAKRLAEKQLQPKMLLGAFVPDGSDGAA